MQANPTPEQRVQAIRQRLATIQQDRIDLHATQLDHGVHLSWMFADLDEEEYDLRQELHELTRLERESATA